MEEEKHKGKLARGTGSADGKEPGDPFDGPVELPIDGVLDLHAFPAREVADLVSDYLGECRRRGILSVRIVHGKGTGVLRRVVQSVLEGDPRVRSFQTADESGGGWGATLVELSKPDG